MENHNKETNSKLQKISDTLANGSSSGGVSKFASRIRSGIMSPITKVKSAYNNITAAPGRMISGIKSKITSPFKGLGGILNVFSNSNDKALSKYNKPILKELIDINKKLAGIINTRKRGALDNLEETIETRRNKGRTLAMGGLLAANANNAPGAPPKEESWWKKILPLAAAFDLGNLKTGVTGMIGGALAFVGKQSWRLTKSVAKGLWSATKGAGTLLRGTGAGLASLSTRLRGALPGLLKGGSKLGGRLLPGVGWALLAADAKLLMNRMTSFGSTLPPNAENLNYFDPGKREDEATETGPGTWDERMWATGQHEEQLRPRDPNSGIDVIPGFGAAYPSQGWGAEVNMPNEQTRIYRAPNPSRLFNGDPMMDADPILMNGGPLFIKSDKEIIVDRPLIKINVGSVSRIGEILSDPATFREGSPISTIVMPSDNSVTTNNIVDGSGGSNNNMQPTRQDLEAAGAH